MDLLCIPQERTALALEEISRQGLIFRRADSVVAWINELSGWESLQNAIEWLSLFYLYSRANVKFCYPKIQPLTPQDHLERRIDSFANATFSCPHSGLSFPVMFLHGSLHYGRCKRPASDLI